MENITNEVMDTMEEVVTVVEMTPVKTRSGLKVAGAAAGVLAVGFGIYKGAKWVHGKIKAKKEQKEIEATCESCDACDIEE